MIASLLALFGTLLVLFRLMQASKHVKTEGILPSDLPFVSIIVPARNEENNLPPLLESLTQLSYQNFEVIVVDDQSTDRTAEIVRRYTDKGVTLIRGRNRQQGWGGKQWACHQGALQASGDLLVFTDADTVHSRESLKILIEQMHAKNLDMISVVPRHAGQTLWESFTGYFQILLMIAANAFGKQVPGRAYCIGQYIAFTRNAYKKLGGHESVKSDLVEDVPLANRALRLRLQYEVFYAKALYQVRMYTSLTSFVAGWRRNFRAGLKDSSPLATLEVVFVFAALIFGGSLSPSLTELCCFAVTLAAMYSLVRRFTNYGAWAVVGFPISLFLFCYITGLAIIDRFSRKDVIWKGRAIAVDG